jgi:predicted MFS family arabinose efflux permease
MALLLRTIAATLDAPDRRARTVALVAGGGVLGGAAAPALVYAGPSLWPAASVSSAIYPWVAVAVGAAAAALVARSVRSGPVIAAHHRVHASTPVSRRAAVVVCIVAGVVMVAVMSTATLQLHHLGASNDAVTAVVAIHYAAMFGCAIPFGALADGRGRRLALGVATTLLVASGVILAADPHGYVGFAVVLGLVGAGWSGAFVTGTTILADAADEQARTRLVACNDLVVAVTSAAAAVVSTAPFSRGGATSIGLAVGAIGSVGLVFAWQLRADGPPTPISDRRVANG